MKKITFFLFLLLSVNAIATDYNYKCGVTIATVEKRSYGYMLKLTQRAKNTSEYGSTTLYDNTVDLAIITDNETPAGTYSTTNGNFNTSLSAVYYGEYTRRLNTSKVSTFTIAKVGENQYEIREGQLNVQSSTYTNQYCYNYSYDVDDLNTKDIGQTPFAFTYGASSATGTVANYDMTVNAITSVVQDPDNSYKYTLEMTCTGRRRLTTDDYNYEVTLVFDCGNEVLFGEYSTTSTHSRLIQPSSSSVTWISGGKTRYLSTRVASNIQILKDGENYTICGGTLNCQDGSDDMWSYHFGNLAPITIDETKNNTALLAGMHDLLISPIPKVQLIRSLSPDYYNTFCSPFDISAADVTDKFGADTDIRELVSSSYDEEKNELTLTFSESSLTAIQAGVPYIIKPGQPVANPTFTNVAPTAVVATPESVETQYVTFHGILNPYTLEADNPQFLFLLADNFLKWGKAGTMKGMRAYFMMDDLANAQRMMNCPARIQLGGNAATEFRTVPAISEPTIHKQLRNGQLVIIVNHGDAQTMYNAQGQIL